MTTNTQTRTSRIARLRNLSVAGVATLGAAAAALTLTSTSAQAAEAAPASASVVKASADGAQGAPGSRGYANNLDGWIKESLAIMKAKGIPGTYEGLHRNIMRESSGNPNAQNNWDVNARNGIPSKGLLQVIQPTFNAYHVSRHRARPHQPRLQHHRGRQLRRPPLRLDRQRQLRLLSHKLSTHLASQDRHRQQHRCPCRSFGGSTSNGPLQVALRPRGGARRPRATGLEIDDGP